MKEIDGKIYMSEEDLKEQISPFLVQDELTSKNFKLSLITGADIFAFIKFVFKKGDEDENNGKMS